MLTLFTAAAVLAACACLRQLLNRPERKDAFFWGGRIRLTALWRGLQPASETEAGNGAVHSDFAAGVGVPPPQSHRSGTGLGRWSQQPVGAAAARRGL